MVVKFTCPQGHPLATGEDRIGKPGKCPKCGVMFVVPGPASASEPSTTEASESASDSAARNDAGSSTAPGKGAAAASAASDSSPGASAATATAAPAKPAEELIVFLCPNGHKLNGPKRLEGMPGQCPHCGARFRIPSYDEADDDEVGEFPEETPVGELVEDEASQAAAAETEGEILELDGAIEVVEESDSSRSVPVAEPPPAMFGMDAMLPPPPPGAPANALGEIFARLWRARDSHSIVELYLGQGEVLEPQHFAPRLSQGTHGVFAVKERDGAYRIVTIPWESVTRVDFGKLKALPPSMFQ